MLASPACRVRPPGELVPTALAGLRLGDTFGRWLRMSESPWHPPLRAAVCAAFAAMPLATVQACAHQLAAAFLADGTVTGKRLDALADYLPAATLAALLGWPEPTWGQVAAQVAALARALAADADAVARARGEAACRDLLAQLASLPASGWLADWRQAFAELGDASLYANLAGMLFQSCDAGAGLISAGMAWRCGAPWDGNDDAEWSRRLQADPVLHHTRRFVAEEVELAGQRLLAGDVVLVLLAAAAQDPAGPGEAMDFGRGRHGCPGERLARAIAKGALAALEAARPDWEALAGSIRFRHLPNARIRRFGAGEVR
ncbi:hypothetical protein [Chromobacterium sp. ASV23]|uniref:hypothetical protein n=1 Tax=Chromobacterium sp. ASV23 TaxID=2795110 RepID=UPI0018EDF347|nr:hypothetical protein [Chromobacterium sp. ASV23]